MMRRQNRGKGLGAPLLVQPPPRWGKFGNPHKRFAEILKINPDMAASWALDRNSIAARFV